MKQTSTLTYRYLDILSYIGHISESEIRHKNMAQWEFQTVASIQIHEPIKKLRYILAKILKYEYRFGLTD